MKIVLNVVGGLLLLLGGIWILQGFGILPGSFMTGQMKWAGYGALAAVAGAGLLFVARRPVP